MKKIIVFIIILAIVTLGIEFFYKPWIYFGLDVVFYPIYNLKSFFSQSLYLHLWDIINLIFGYQFYWRLLLFCTFLVWTLLWIYIWNLIWRILNIKDEKKLFFIKFFSISFIVFNPFVYERFITQTNIILSIYFIWFGLISLIEYILTFKNNKLYLSWIFFWISFMIMPHTLVFLLIIFITTLSFFYKNFSIKKIFFSISIVFLINSNWLIWSLFLNETKSLWKISTFNVQNIEAFTSNNLNSLWVEITNILLYWFWWGKYNRLDIPDNNYWYLAWFLILWIIIYGWYELYKIRKKLTLYLLSLATFAYILWLWISSTLFSWINELLYEYIPYYIWMREPQKLIGILMIVYSIFFLIWAYTILEKNKTFKRKEYFKKIFLNNYFVMGYILILILIWSPNVLFWFNGQLKISNYPKEIFQSRDNLIEYNDTNVLILPWHSYMACEWSYWTVFYNHVKNILLPINVISSDNIEIGHLYTNNKNNNRSKKIDKFIETKDFSILKKLNIDTIYFMDKCADFPKYNYLEKSKKLKKVFESNYIKIYKIK